jgi:hypothetical protein
VKLKLDENLPESAATRLGATLIVLGVTTADTVYVPNRVASVSFVPVVGWDRAGGALKLTF